MSKLGAWDHHCADDIFKCIFLNGSVWISHKISLKFVPEARIKNITALVQIMAWRRPGDNALSEPMMVSLLTHICVTRPQWVLRGVPKMKFVYTSEMRIRIIYPWGHAYRFVWRMDVNVTHGIGVSNLIWCVLCQKQVSRAGTSNYIPHYLWDVITCPCPWYLSIIKGRGK